MYAQAQAQAARRAPTATVRVLRQKRTKVVDANTEVRTG
jgi:hypothetical protein